MTKIKLCGLSRFCDIEAVNILKPEYIGFVFAENSRRYVSPEDACLLKKRLSSEIKAVGVFVREDVKVIADLLGRGIIDAAQLHGGEEEAYIRYLRKLTGKPIIKAFRIETAEDIIAAERSSADHLLLDSGEGGTGSTFDWGLLKRMKRPYFLAGGLTPENVGRAVGELHPYAVDVSSGVETNRKKDRDKMAAFVAAVRKEEER
jgi:Phosphoribosylanthranilate isomerase